MYLSRLVTLVVLGGVVTAPLAAQGIPRGPRSTQAVNTAPRLMVANPFAFAPGDSAPAVAIGSGVREEMKDVVGRDYQVIEQTQMNDALTQYGYPKDAILSPALALTLAKNIQARFLAASTMSKTGDRYTVTGRVTGVNDDAGYVVTLTQNPGETPQAFGKRLAAALEPAIKALADGKGCIDQRASKPDKAIESANKAIKAVPNHGLAEYCLALIAQDKKQPRQEVVKHLQASAKGDPMSLPVWTALATQYQAANDTANTLAAFKQMLRVAPTNQKLREQLFKYFLQSGHPEVALQVADEGLKIDPYNADLYDLKSNACLFLGNFKCAVDALETMYATDSTKADTLFFTKISAAAAEGEKPDTARLVKWAQMGVKKYPDNVTLLGYLNRAYSLTGQVDSSMAITQRLMTKDTTIVKPALHAVQTLALANRTTEMAPFIDYVKKYANPQEKEQLAAVLLNAAIPALQGDSAKGIARNYEAAGTYAMQAGQLASPGGKVKGTADYILGIAYFQQAAEMDPQTEKQKSCEMAVKEEQLIISADSALALGQAAQPETVAKYRSGVKQFQPRIKAMKKSYCKNKR
jgi:tetratricopeptide (TPR) repeat protein